VALARLGAEPGEAVYVGDSEVDLETARRAGLPCIAVAWGFRDEPELLAAGAGTIIHKPEELLKLL
jgi:phosphoglycolate phosphatase